MKEPIITMQSNQKLHEYAIQSLLSDLKCNKPLNFNAFLCQKWAMRSSQAIAFQSLTVQLYITTGYKCMISV